MCEHNVCLHINKIQYWLIVKHDQWKQSSGDDSVVKWKHSTEQICGSAVVYIIANRKITVRTLSMAISKNFFSEQNLKVLKNQEKLWK